MDKKIVFVDVDGTLCGHDGSVPKSASQAIKQARQKGHKIYLCTGRSKAEITEEIQSVGFDGMIGAGGGYIEMDGHVVQHITMDEAKVKRIEAYFDEHRIGYYLETNNGLFASKYCVEAIGVSLDRFVQEHPEYAHLKTEGGTNWFIDILNESKGKEIDYSQINKISFISNDHPYSEVDRNFGDDFEMHHSTVAMMGKDSGEVSVKGITKFTAVNKVLQEGGFDVKDTLAYGDGANDIDMFRAVQIGVAMENAKPALYEIANDVTKKAEDDGIALSFLKYGLIDSL